MRVAGEWKSGITRDLPLPSVTGSLSQGASGRATQGASRLCVTAPDDAMEGGDMSPVGGPAGLGEAQPDPLPGVANGAAPCETQVMAWPVAALERPG